MATKNSFSSTLAASLRSKALAPVPTQTFAAQNVIGTPTPQVGDQVSPSYVVGTGSEPKHVILWGLAIAVIGYGLWHYNFRKG